MSELADKKLLVVGAGGIGCELLKNLVMTGFKDISIVDLDKVEKSNLNRQFLYTSESIGKYKSEMAKAAIEKMREDLRLTAYVGNIKNLTMFDHEFFKKFNVILNALDNIDARTYINTICVDFNIPLVNSGTEGFLGGVSCHMKGLSPCYNCIPRSNDKKYPVCSIRSKPEKIEHCVAWAKALFELIYCQGSNGNLLEDYNIDSINQEAFDKLFNTEIIEIKETKPINELLSGDICYDEFNTKLYIYDDNDDISLENLMSIFFASASRLIKKAYDKFDKENKDIVNFVYASSNLRAYNFSIKKESRFKIKEIAGNIIPAIASTNAVIAAIQTLEAVKLIQGMKNFKNVSLTKDKKITSILSTSEMISKECVICSENKHLSTIELNFKTYAVDDFIKLLKTEFELDGFMVTLNKNEVIYDDEDSYNDDEPIKTFSELVSENMCKINVMKGDDKLQFLVSDNPEINGKEYKLVKVNSYTSETEQDKIDQKIKDIVSHEIIDISDDELEIIENKTDNEEGNTLHFLKKKRKLESKKEEIQSVKKMKYI
jgi:ubiquitin-like 1-activating enzyme E1 B